MHGNQQLDRRLRHALLASVLIFECVTLPRSVHAQAASIKMCVPHSLIWIPRANS